MSQTPKVIEFLRKKGREESKIAKIVLFGSRARDEDEKRSDYDIAVYVDSDLSHAEWARLSLSVEEEVPTLCGLDLVLVNDELSERLREAIEKQGKVIYEKN